MKTAETITIEKRKLQELLDSFYKACDLLNELNIHDNSEDDEHQILSMRDWVEVNFGKEIK